ncbi:PREDICTED: elongation factor 1-delta-like, partial [Diuraphis noxia]|uniref:elongation factor 1-delta-like n=1 Tax=Diuraphis noxia TaxID=143948 RepID=UPI0007638A0B
MSLEILAQEKVWLDKSKYADAERVYYEKLSKNSSSNSSSLNQDIEQLQSLMVQLEARVASLETKKAAQSPKPEEKETPKKNDKEDDDVDLFGSESEVNIFTLIILKTYFSILRVNYIQ